MKLLPIFCANLTAYATAYQSRGVRRQDLARLAGVSKGQFSDLCNGKVAAPTIWTAKRVADALGVTLDDLITTDPKRRESVEWDIVTRLV